MDTVDFLLIYVSDILPQQIVSCKLAKGHLSPKPYCVIRVFLPICAPPLNGATIIHGTQALRRVDVVLL